MDLSKLKPAKGAIKKSKRIGRGEGSGHGDTATKGHKGQQSRSGYKRKKGFEGGQMPLYRRLPKFGFNNPNRIRYNGVNVDTLQKIAEEKGITEFNMDVFIQNGLASKSERVKILGRGDLNTKIEVTAHAFTKKAITLIEAQGGTAKKI